MYLLKPKATLSFILLALYINSTQSACPHANDSSRIIPDDTIHKSLQQQRHSNRRLASLADDPNTRHSIESVISHLRGQQQQQQQQRSLQTTPCVDIATYESITTTIASLSNAITDLGDRGHFLGGILRLAAHDFMDYDRNDAAAPLGPDGCLDLSHPNNAGLDTIWCDDPIACPFKAAYDEGYSQTMSVADYWVAGANAVVKVSSGHVTPALELPFRWGRVDATTCEESSGRLPADDGCTAVEGVFLDRMGLSWTDAAALMGGHTLGRGDENFSGHPGTWVDGDEMSTMFDKAYYRELVARPWRPRTLPDGRVDWVWGGRDRNVMMLNADVCLYFDIPDGNTQTCCTNTERDCRGFFQDTMCPLANQVRPEAVAAIDDFMRGGQDNNQVFYEAFAVAWQKATESGHSNLNDLQQTCEVNSSTPTASPVLVTSSPTSAPITSSPTAAPVTSSPTSAPISSSPTVAPVTPTPPPVSPISSSPTLAPIPATPSPTTSPVTTAPTTACRDLPSFLDGKNRLRDCPWVISRDKCDKFEKECPVSCQVGCGAIATSSPTAAPTPEGQTPVPTSDCNDLPSFIDKRGRVRDCAWAQSTGRCSHYREQCPVTCKFCSTLG